MKSKGFDIIASRIFVFLFIFLAYPAVGGEQFYDSNLNVLTRQPMLYPDEANEGSFEGGVTGTKSDTLIHIQVPEEIQRGGSEYNIPTGAPPSPMVFPGGTVTPFSQKLLRFEEFGTQPLLPDDDPAYFNADGSPAYFMPLPPPRAGIVAEGEDPYDTSKKGPNWDLLDLFLEQPIQPYPTNAANDSDKNPWNGDISNFLGRTVNGPAEGRPPGRLWSHQRIDEINPATGVKDFYPKVYFQSAQAGARNNGGLRDKRQRHEYGFSEFGPIDSYNPDSTGLYYNTVGGGSEFDGTTKGIQIKFHPAMPTQEENSLFTFDGTLPPKLLQVRYGEGVLFRHYNALPIDPAANNGFGLHTLSTHEHNGHIPAESDGFTNAFFFPGQFFDYRWPIILAGYDGSFTGNNDGYANGSNPRAGMPDGNGGIIPIRGDYRETVSTQWFHDHMLDFTASNVYKGNAAMMNYYSSIDRGNEVIDDGINLRFPSGTALDWGNRDYDVNLLIAAKAWDNNGQLFFNPFNTDGFLGDRMTVNWLYKPTMDVRARRYRLRLLNGSVSRYLKLAFVTGTGERVPFHMIANDGNIMEHSLYFSDGILPVQAIAERYDIIINFANYAPGTRIYMVNVLEHKNGRGPEKDVIPLGSIPLPGNFVLPDDYNPVIESGEWKGGDPVVGTVMEFVVRNYDGADFSMNPALYEVGGLKMIPLPGFTDAELANATHRTFDFGRSSGTDEQPWTIKTDGGTGYSMDPRRVTAAPDRDAVEIWHMNTGGGWSHPIHVHFEEGTILSRDGMKPPEWETLSRKDVYRIGPEVDSSRQITVAFRFREFGGTYMEHCHNTQHEDTAMLMRWDIQTNNPTLLPTPMPTWDGVALVDSFALATYKSGDINAAKEGVEIPIQPANGGDVNHDGVIDRIFSDAKLRLKSPPAMELDQVPDMQHILNEYIADSAMVVALGKAFFWDQTVGSDGQACASCHFSAGADSRSNSQLSPGLLNQQVGFDPLAFDLTNSGGGGINYQLTQDDFPFPRNFDDVVGSQGTVDARLVVGSRVKREKGDKKEQEDKKDKRNKRDKKDKRDKRSGVDQCTNLPSDFSLAGLNHRKVTGRNTPTVINAVFNHRNFWDGRANNMFNGLDPFGARSNLNNPDQGIWIYDSATGQTTKEQVLIKNSSLASQAVGPALSTVEMACAGRTFPLLGRKMLKRRALDTQRVARNDSVFGSMTGKRGRGLRYRYKDMIRLAFKPEFWASDDEVEEDLNQMEANFSLFWGLAIQMYESTLVSNMTPFDEFARGVDAALTEQEKLGLEVFIREDRGSCASCHVGSAFTSASVASRALVRDGGGVVEVAELPEVPSSPLERMRLGDGGIAVYDGGFYNIGVTLTDMDKCIGADVGGYPLSFSRQAAISLIVDEEALQDSTGSENDFVAASGPVQFAERLGVDGACKTPTIRNVELTAPYFHNGSHSTLEQVTLSYLVKFKHLYAQENQENISPLINTVDIEGLAFDGKSIRGGEFDALVAFMKALTDERVRLHQAPFDHPSLVISNGSTGEDANGDGRADDIRRTIPAVGADGYEAPLPKFLESVSGEASNG